jgi:hypothetical protein
MATASTESDDAPGNAVAMQAEFLGQGPLGYSSTKKAVNLLKIPAIPETVLKTEMLNGEGTAASLAEKALQPFLVRSSLVIAALNGRCF